MHSHPSSSKDNKKLAENYAMRLKVSQGHQTWYHSIC